MKTIRNRRRGEDMERDDSKLLAYWIEEAGCQNVDELLDSEEENSGICRSCRGIQSPVDPDADDNYCFDCDKPHVVSLYMLAGLI